MDTSINFNSPAEEKMGSFIKNHNVALSFRTKGKENSCHAYFADENLKIIGTGKSITEAYNSMLLMYIEVREEQEMKNLKIA